MSNDNEPVTAKITVVQKQGSKLLKLLHWTIFWAILVCAVGVNRIWFGGSLLIELLATIFSICVLVVMARKSIGYDVEMRPDELRAWLSAGAPKNVVAWRKGLLPVEKAPNANV